MAEKSRKGETAPETLSKRDYRARLHALQVELVKLQRYFISRDEKILVLLEGRDAAGKDGTIKRITKHLSPRETRVVALGKPSDREESQWYFQRFVQFLPSCQEFVLFNRSWYNRAGVERVMGFATEAEVHEFFDSVLEFEEMQVRAGTRLFKYYLDISRTEQEERLAARRVDPLKQWKVSPIDAKAIELFDAYSRARDDMLVRTSRPNLPWTIVRADNKRLTRLNLIANLLSRIDYDDRDTSTLEMNADVVFPFHERHLKDGSIAR